MLIDISAPAYVWQLNMQRILYLNTTKVGHLLGYFIRQRQSCLSLFGTVFV